MSAESTTYSVDGVISAVGSVLAAVFGFLVWRRQIREDSISVTILNYKTGPAGFTVTTAIINHSNRPAHITKVTTPLGTFGLHGDFDPATGNTGPMIDSEKTSLENGGLLYPGESENKVYTVFTQTPPQGVSIKVKKTNPFSSELDFVLSITPRKG